MATAIGWERERVEDSPSFRVKELEEQLYACHSSFVCALNQLLDLKDLNTGYHSTRLAEWAVRTAQTLGIEDEFLRDIETAALLHDIGKIGVPDAILRKPGRLTDEERALMNRHPEYGWAVARLLPGMDRASLYILHHHENFEGTGYPGKLRGEEIPVGSRIVSVIDAFDAMISSRPYRQGLPIEEALSRLILASGTQFDPDVVGSFVHIAGQDARSVFAATGTSTSVVL